MRRRLELPPNKASDARFFQAPPVRARLVGLLIPRCLSKLSTDGRR